VPEVPGVPAQIPFKPRPLTFIEGSGAARPLTISQPIEPTVLEPLYPALDRSWILPEEQRHLTAALPIGYQQNSVEPMVIPRFVRSLDLLPNRDAHYFRVLDLQLPHGYPH